ncbi:MAG TPA: hypothetical protein VFM83_12355 [Gaiellaceae bacterium]|nr:hypothetical protein [Gaiellaceae bacterium]
MHRLLVLALLALGLTIVFAPAATPAAPGDAKGPSCSNITNGDGGYSTAGVVDFTVFLQAPECKFVDYSFFVTDTTGNPVTLLSQTRDANCSPETTDGGCLHFVFTLPSDGPSTVCVSATTEIQVHLADLAPNASDPTCPASSPSTSLVKGGSGASGGFG